MCLPYRPVRGLIRVMRFAEPQKWPSAASPNPQRWAGLGRALWRRAAQDCCPVWEEPRWRVCLGTWSRTRNPVRPHLTYRKLRVGICGWQLMEFRPRGMAPAPWVPPPFCEDELFLHWDNGVRNISTVFVKETLDGNLELGNGLQQCSTAPSSSSAAGPESFAASPFQFPGAPPAAVRRYLLRSRPASSC
jgi:hypothetical protein